MRILGIDPGSHATGFGVVERIAGRVVHVAHGTLRTGRSATRAERLARLRRGICEVVAEHRPDTAVVEQVFVAASPRSALILGEARGAVLSALGEAGLTVSEYATRAVKQSLTGSGAAEKRQVQRMVQVSLCLASAPAQDAADALALAICHAGAARLVALGAGRPARRGRARAGAWVVRRAR